VLEAAGARRIWLARFRRRPSTIWSPMRLAASPARCCWRLAAVAGLAERNQVPSLAAAAIRCRGLADDDPATLAAVVRAYQPAGPPYADDRIRRMADVSCCRGRHGQDSVAEGRRRSPRSAQADPHGGIMANSSIPLRPARLAQDGPCSHQPPCPDALAPDRIAARLVARNPEQGWRLLCNGVVLFDDGSQRLPDGQTVSPATAAT
jgi:hypothetical protein